MKRILLFLTIILILSACEVQDYIFNSKSYACSVDKIEKIVEKDSTAVLGKVFFSGDTIRTDTVELFCKEDEILGVSRKMNSYYTVEDATKIGIDLTNIKGTPYKIIVSSKRVGISQVQTIYAQGVLPKGKVGYTLSGTGDVATRNPFLKNKKVVTTDKLPKSEVQRIHNTAKAMKKETSYPTGKRKLKQYTGNGLYYIAEENGFVWGVWLIGDITPPKGDLS